MSQDLATGWRDLVTGRRRGPAASTLRLLLRIVSLPYAAVTAVRNALYDRGRLPAVRVGVPVISIGNLTVGGTGKTPTVEWIARWFLSRGRRVAILSRGYGATAGPNDEALVLAQNLPTVPHGQGADRVALARQAIEQDQCDILILDDGFQHRRLHRDLDILLIDATNPFGGGWQLPAGLLRESVASLRRAHLVMITRSSSITAAQLEDLEGKIAKFGGVSQCVEVNFVPTTLLQESKDPTPIDFLRGRAVLAFSGIGNPEAFAATIRHIGVSVVDCRSFPDHHPYAAADIADLERWVGTHSADAVVTTQKDLVKVCRDQLAGLDLYAVGIQATIGRGSEELDARLASMLRRND